jgi:phosphoketolase
VGIQKAYGDMSVMCRKEELTGMGVFKSSSNGGVWGNILAGGIIGYAVDANTGAGFDYQQQLVVEICDGQAGKKTAEK